jgi:DNA-binding response OmpR family regulator
MSQERVTILIAGENPADLEKIAICLRAEGFKVQTVSDLTAIIMLARSETPDLILLDLNSCFDICRMLKRNFVTEPIPIIALLFPAEEVDRVAALELGADDCMAKPFNLG